MRREVCVPSPILTGQRMMLFGKASIDTLDLKLTGERWAFAERERVRIDAHWQELVAINPALWMAYGSSVDNVTGDSWSSLAFQAR